MSFLRRSLFASTIANLILISAISTGTAYALSSFSRLEPQIINLISIGTFLFLTIVLVFWRLWFPIKKVIREMKALLTGKPYHRIITEKQNEIGILAHFFNEVTRNLESIYGDVKTHRRIQKELDSAQDIQRMLIPKSAPEMEDLEITAKTRPASEIGGDTFDFYIHKNRNLIYVGDSTGHGIPAGIVMVMVDVLLETFIDIKDSLKEIVIILNKYLKPHLKPSMFMTMMLLEWLPQESKIKWAGAGHEYIIHVHTLTGKAEAVKTGGLAIGMIADNTKFVTEQEMILEENDFVVLYSDGISEAKNMLGEEYGLKSLQTFIESQASIGTTSEDLFKKIAMDVGRFMEGATQLDDMTLIVMKHTEKKSSPVDTTTEWRG